MRAADTVGADAAKMRGLAEWLRDTAEKLLGQFATVDDKIGTMRSGGPNDPQNQFADETDGLEVDGKRYLPGNLPSYAELLELTKTDPNEAYYWSGRDSNGVGVGPDGSRIAERLAAEANATTLKMLLERKGMVPVPGWDVAEPETIRFWDEAAKAYAENACGTVTAIVGCDVRPDNIWQRVEVPRLTNNPKVTEIIQIDPDSRRSKVIFQRYLAQCSWSQPAQGIDES